METQFITNEKGEKTGVILTIKDDEKLLDIAEEYADIKAFDEAVKKIEQGKETIIPFEEVKNFLRNSR